MQEKLSDGFLYRQSGSLLLYQLCSYTEASMQFAQIRTYDAGDNILTEGDPGHEFYIIDSGEVVVTKSNSNGYVSARRSSGQKFRELNLSLDFTPLEFLSLFRCSVFLQPNNHPDYLSDISHNSSCAQGRKPLRLSSIACLKCLQIAKRRRPTWRRRILWRGCFDD